MRRAVPRLGGVAGPSTSPGNVADRVIWQAASIALSYPDRAALDRTEVAGRALAEAAPEALAHFATLLADRRNRPLAALQTEYVDLFDLSRKHALYLSYWTDGDTRRRGEVLARFKERYRASGSLVNLRGELPDYLPLVCEYAAVVDPADGAALLQQYRPSLELLRLALLEKSSAYAGVLAAVCGTLPGASPTDRREVLARAQAGPPTEAVGLDPYQTPAALAATDGRRLLPLVERR